MNLNPLPSTPATPPTSSAPRSEATPAKARPAAPQAPQPANPPQDSSRIESKAGSLIAPVDLFGQSEEQHIRFNEVKSYPPGANLAAIKNLGGGEYAGLHRTLVTDPNQQTFPRLVQAMYPDAIGIQAENNETVNFVRANGKSYQAKLIFSDMGIMLNALGMDVKPVAKTHQIPRLGQVDTPDKVDVQKSADGKQIQIQWDSLDGSMAKALEKALPGAKLGKPYGEHPYTHYDVTTPKGESWKLTWLTGGFVASYGATLNRVETAK